MAAWGNTWRHSHAMLLSPGPEEGLPDQQILTLQSRQGEMPVHSDPVVCAGLWVWVCNIHSLQLPHAGRGSQVQGGLAVLLCWDLLLGPVQTWLQALPSFLRRI